MTQQQLDETNIKIARQLIDNGALGARLLSAKQIGKAAFRLSLQTDDDQRIEVTMKADVNIEIISSMEIRNTNAGENSGPTGS